MGDCQKNTEETVSLLCNPQEKRRCPRNVGETPKEMGETPRNLGEPVSTPYVMRMDDDELLTLSLIHI